jgi:hypothetical protein
MEVRAVQVNVFSLFAVIGGWGQRKTGFPRSPPGVKQYCNHYPGIPSPTDCAPPGWPP